VLVPRPFRDGAAQAIKTAERGGVGRAIAAVGELLPSLVSPWVNYFAANPGELAIGLAVVLALM
jgi:hypothetical protein